MKYPSKETAFLALVSIIVGFILGDLYGGYAPELITAIILLGGGAFGLGAIALGAVFGYLTAPSLNFGGIVRNPEGTHFLVVKKKSGEGLAVRCEGLLSIIGTPRRDVPTVWEHPNAIYLADIGTYRDLQLFQVREPTSTTGTFSEKTITFFSANSVSGFHPNAISYEKNKNLKLRVTLVSRNGRMPKPFEKTVSEIIAEARPQLAV